MSMNSFGGELASNFTIIKEVHPSNQTQEEIDELKAAFIKGGGKIDEVKDQLAVRHMIQ